jgi:hypothetical protein
VRHVAWVVMGLAATVASACELDSRVLTVLDARDGAGGASPPSGVRDTSIDEPQDAPAGDSPGTHIASTAGDAGILMDAISGDADSSSDSRDADAGGDVAASGLFLLAGALEQPTFAPQTVTALVPVRNPGMLYVMAAGVIVETVPDIGSARVVGSSGVNPLLEGGFGVAAFIQDGASDLLYVADPLSCVVRRVRISTGEMTAVAGDPAQSCGTDVDGRGSSARFSGVNQIGFCGNTPTLLVSENGSLRSIDVDTGDVKTVATLPADTFQMACDGDDFGNYGNHLYVAAFDSSTIYDVEVGTWSVKAHPVSIPAPNNNGGPPLRIALAGSDLYVPGLDGVWQVDLTTFEAKKFMAWPKRGSWGLDGIGDQGSMTCLGEMSADGNQPPQSFFIADNCEGTIRKMSGDMLTTVPLEPKVALLNGSGEAARFGWPTGVTADDAGNVYVADGQTIREIAAGSHVVSTFPEEGSLAGGAAPDGFLPGGVPIVFDGGDSLYLGDAMGGAILKVLIRTGEVSTFIGGQFDPIGGPGDTGIELRPSSLAFERASGTLFVGDVRAHTISTIDVKTKQLGPPMNGYKQLKTLLGPADGVVFPTGLAVDRHGRLFIADAGLRTIGVVNSAGGALAVLAGLTATPGTSDGAGPRARFLEPTAIASDGDDALFVAEGYAGTVRKIVVSTGEVTTFVGSFPDDVTRFAVRRQTVLGPLPGLLYDPRGIALGPAGELFISVPNAVLVAR